MTAQQTKLALAAAVVLAVLAGTYGLTSSTSKKDVAEAEASGEMGGADLRQARVGTRGANGSGGNDSATIKAKNSGSKKGGSSADDAPNSGIAAILDGSTTEVQPIETEAETRERERYEKAMENQFKYRELDPEKIKPVELAPALQTVTKEYGLPENLLAAMMYVETGGAHRDGDHSIDAGYGVMNLRENNLVDTAAEGASLIGKSKEDVLYDQAANIKAAGALVKSYYDDGLASGLSESEALYAAVSQYTGYSDPELAASLADETAGMLMKGFEIHLSDGGGDLVVPPTANPPFYPKNWKVTGLTPPGQSGGTQEVAGSTPPNAQSYGDGSAAGGAQVAP